MARPSATPVNSAPPSPPSPPPPPPEPLYESVPITSPRSLRQMAVFAFGATCFIASTAITRRAIYRRSIRIKPKFYEPNTNPHEHFSPFHDALQALNLASINCFSLGIMSMGGAMWAFDIAGLKEAQSKLRGHLQYDAFYESNEMVPDSIAGLLLMSQEKEEKTDTADDNGPGAS